MPKTTHRITAFLAGTVILLLALELGLRVVHAVYELRSRSDLAAPASAARHTVLCVGDSVTFGLGAPRNLSYPAQLQQLLNPDDKNARVAVVNRGRPGHNSALLLKTIEQDIVAVKPDTILILIGGANQWNFWGYRDHLEKKRWTSYFNDQLYRIRLFKLAKLLHGNLQSRKRYIGPRLHDSIYAFEPDMAPPEVTEKVISDARGSNSGEAYALVGRSYMQKGDYDQALHWFREGIRVDPGFGLNYTSLGWLYREKKQPEKALYWFKKGMEVAPADPSDYHAYDAIASGFFDLDLYQEPIDYFKKEARRNPVAHDFLLMYGDGNKAAVEKRVRQWVAGDLERILSMCEKYQLTVLLQSYPDYWDRGLYELVGRTAQQLSDTHDFHFIDHYRVFTDMVAGGARHGDFFVPDDHPNAAGYGIMAETILDTLKKKALLW